MATIVSVPLAQQLQVPFIDMRSLYEVRERPSKMYSWTALLTAQILAEVPWNILGSSLFFLCWYWTVGYSSEAMRAGYVYLALGVLFPLYYTTIGQVSAIFTIGDVGIGVAEHDYRLSRRWCPMHSSRHCCSVSCSRSCLSCECLRVMLG